MDAETLEPEWRYNNCKGKACFVSELMVCVPFKDELSFFGLDGTKKNGEPWYEFPMCFLGPHLMVTFSYERMKVFSLINWKVLCEEKVLCEGAQELTSCPWRKNALCLRTPKQMAIVSINLSKGDFIAQWKYTLETKYLKLKKGKNGKLVAASGIGEVTLVSHCWMPPGDKLLVQTEREGMVYVDALSLDCSSRVLRGQEEEIVRCMVADEGSRLFAGFDSGIVQMVDVSKGSWVVLETIDVNNVRWISLSPSMESILLTTVDGSVVHRHIKNEENTDIVRKPVLESIGVCPVGDSHCAVVGRDGSLAIHNRYDGKPVGALTIGEDCKSVAFSPLCRLLVLGACSGSLHFVSAVDPSSPKVVHCDQPFLSPVSCLAFDPQGKLLVAGSAAMDSEHVHVFDGRPWFKLLVLVPMPGPVIDLAFNAEGTYLVAMVKSEPGSAVLYRTYLPEDLLLNLTNYQANEFHTFTGNVETQRITGLTSDILGYHPKFGFFYHHGEELKRLPAFKNPVGDGPSYESLSICKMKGRLSKLRISPDLLWLAFINEKGFIIVYKIGENLTFSTENRSYSSIEFSLWGEGVLAGDQTSRICYFQLPSKVSEENIIPEWLYICRRDAVTVNHQLSGGEKESDIEEFKSNSFLEWQENFLAKTQLDMMFFVLNKLSLEQAEDLDLDEDSVFDNVVNDLYEHNLIKYLACGGSGVNEKPPLDPTNEIISYSDCYVQNYLVPRHVKKHSQKPEQIEFNFFSCGMKLKNVEERLTVVKEIRKYIEFKKLEFNRDFDEFYDNMYEPKEKVYDIYDEMRDLSAALPSKSERNMWLAYVEHCEYENSLPEITKKSEDLSDQDGSEIDDAKRKIERLAKKASLLKKEYDLQVEHFYEEKRKCNVLIGILELTNYCVLLHTLAEIEIEKYEDMITEKISYLIDSESQVRKILSEMEELEKEYAQIFDKGFKLERLFENKVRMKVDSERLHHLYFQSPDSNNQEAVSTEFSTEKPFPTNDKTWDTICKNRERRMKMNHFLKEVESQTGDLIDIKFKVKERANTLEINQNRLNNYSSGLTAVFSKLSYTVHKLLTVDFACDSENTDLSSLEKCFTILNIRLKEFEEMLRLTFCSIESDCNRCVEPVGELTDRLEKARNLLRESKEKLDSLGISKWSKMFRIK